MNAAPGPPDKYAFGALPGRHRPFGVVLPATVRAWHLEVVDWLLRVPGAELVRAVRGGPGVRRTPSRARSLRAVDAGELVRGVRIEEPDDSAGWEDLDFVLSFAPLSWPVAPGSIPRSGVWAFTVGSEGEARPGFHEIAARQQVAHAALVRLDPGGGAGELLRQGWFRIAAHSLAATTDRILFGVAPFAALALRDLETGAKPEERLAPAGVAYPTARDRMRRLRATAGSLAQRLRYGVSQRERWNVGIYAGGLQDLLAAPNLAAVRWLPEEGRRRYLADPFPVPGTNTLLVEAWDDRAGHASLAAVSTEGRRQELSGLAMPGVHLSYPYVFLSGDDVYCVPETAERRQVLLYRAIDSGRTWEPAGTLLGGVAAIDSTIFRHGSTWWLACTDWDVDPHGQLFLWYADELTGPWRPHRRNPVKIDPRSSRPAGTPVEVDGQLWRPAQDCGGGYGRRVVVSRITELGPDVFSEEPVATLNPDPAGPYPHGLHTLATDGTITVVDGKRDGFRLLAALGHLRARLRARRLGF